MERRCDIRHGVATFEQEIAIPHVNNAVIALLQDPFRTGSIISVVIERIDITSSIQEDVISVTNGIGEEIDVLAFAQMRYQCGLGRDGGISRYLGKELGCLPVVCCHRRPVEATCIWHRAERVVLSCAVEDGY